VKSNSLITNIRWLAFVNLLTKPIWFVFFLIVARVLGPEEYGKLMYALSFSSIIAVLFEGGVDMQTTRYLAQDKKRFYDFIPNSLTVKIWSGLGIIVTSLLFIWIKETTYEIKLLLLLATGYVLINSITTHIRFIFRGFEVMKYEGLSIITEKILVILLGGLSLYIQSKAIFFINGYFIAYLGLLVLTIYILITKIGYISIFSIHTNLFKYVIKPSLPYALMSFFMIIYFRAATILIEYLTHNQSLVGLYNSGYRIVEASLLFPSIIMMPLYPVLARRSNEREFLGNLLNKALGYILLISFLISIPCSLFSFEVIQLLYGQNYTSASICFSIIVLSIIPISFTWVFGTLVAAIGRQVRANYYIFIITILNVVLNYFLIPKHGINAAALITLLTEIAIGIINIYIVRDYLNWKMMTSMLFRLILISIVCIICTNYVVSYLSIPLKISIVMIVILLSFLSFQLVKINDLLRFLKIKNV
jgi:O-antigen/teichoic acid export membrane protein